MAQRKRAQHPTGFEFLSASVEETHAFGERLGQALRAGDVVALCGELGSGKTTLIQGIAQGTGRNPDTVKSPTFVLMREYPGDVPIVHIDGYRLEGAPAVAWLDTDFIFSPEKITLIEWAERFEGLLPEQALALHASHVSANRRRFVLASGRTRADELIAQLSQFGGCRGAGPAQREDPHRAEGPASRTAQRQAPPN